MKITVMREEGEKVIVVDSLCGYTVKFYNKDGIHMDASDLEFPTLKRALNLAIPSTEEYTIKFHL